MSENVTDEVRYRRTIWKFNGDPIPANGCYYCASTDGPFEEWGNNRLLKCKGECE